MNKEPELPFQWSLRERIRLRISRAKKKIIRVNAIIILLIAAIWYARKILTFSSLSEPDAKFWLDFSEIALMASAAFVAIGLFGELSESEAWKKSFWYEAAKWVVIIGIAIELLGDAGVFEAGDRIQEVNDRIIRAQRSKILAVEHIIVPRRLAVGSLLAMLNVVVKECPQFVGLKPPPIMVQTVPEWEPERFTQELQEVLAVYQWQMTEIGEKQSGLDPVSAPDGVTVFTPSTQPAFIPGIKSAATPENPTLIKGAKAIVDCVNTLYGPGSASTHEMPMPNLHTPGYPFFFPQPQSLVIIVGASPIGEKLYLLEKQYPGTE